MSSDVFDILVYSANDSDGKGPVGQVMRISRQTNSTKLGSAVGEPREIARVPPVW